MMNISREQIQQFDELGFLVLRQLIPPDMITRLRIAVDSAIAGALEPTQLGSSDTEFCITRVEGTPFVTYIDHLHRHVYPASLELAGSPQMQSIGQAFCGDDYLVSYEYAVVKSRGDGQRIPWHQDMIHDRSSRILNLGLYLSEATASEGAVRVIPRTQFAPQDICSIQADGRLERTCVEMAPGDALLHDVMLVHSSEGLVTQGQRQVLYFELRSLQHLHHNNRVSRQWISARQHLQEIAEVAYQRSVAGAADTGQSKAIPPSSERYSIEEIYNLPSSREAARYCIQQMDATTHAV